MKVNFSKIVPSLLLITSLFALVACGNTSVAVTPSSSEPISSLSSSETPSSSQSVSVSTHTHTFATEWSFDETHHWHAATCEHTDEKSDYAEHTFDGDVCIVCGYMKLPEQLAGCSVADDPKCPICGGCINERCTDANCVECGSNRSKDNFFEAESAVLVNGSETSGQQFSISEKIDTGEEACAYLQGIVDNVGGTVTFTVNSDKAAWATLRLRIAKHQTSPDPKFTTCMTTIVNDEILERDTVVPPVLRGIKYKREFDWNNLGCVKLLKGENVIQFAVSGSAMGYNFDKIDLRANDNVSLTWTATDNSALHE